MSAPERVKAKALRRLCAKQTAAINWTQRLSTQSIDDRQRGKGAIMVRERVDDALNYGA